MSAEELELSRRKEERLQQELELRKEEMQMQRDATTGIRETGEGRSVERRRFRSAETA